MQWIGDAVGGHLRLIDQTRLPGELVYLECHDVRSLVDAIGRLVVRGAPAIGCAAAYGCVMGARDGDLAGGIEQLAASRPTAVNLFWALDRIKALGADDPEAVLGEARTIQAEDEQMCAAIGRHGRALIGPEAGVLTHCNAGALATAGVGTATAPMYLAHSEGAVFRVYADETRPLLQGGRLTAWELAGAGIDVTLLCDDAAASLMQSGQVDLVLTGADRIAANGDVANKIGTYNLAVLARHHGIDFYVAAPCSTFDLACPDRGSIPIEQRSGDEVVAASGYRGSVDCLRIHNPAFDVTPADLVSGIVTDRGIIRPVGRETVAAMIGPNRAS
ncbi:MAG: S-methyl-5-thioribose-1-phosphate isomerase [Phycisphaerae bacterium]|nr:S-methyl-5-thioribose-1-phosphate isomerase [Phycisphaerae bacterium]